MLGWYRGSPINRSVKRRGGINVVDVVELRKKADAEHPWARVRREMTPTDLTLDGVVGGPEIEVPAEMAWAYQFNCAYNLIGGLQAGQWSGEGLVVRGGSTNLSGSFPQIFMRGEWLGVPGGVCGAWVFFFVDLALYSKVGVLIVKF